MIYYIGAGINFFLLLILLFKKGKSFADRVLLCWLLVIGVHMLLYILNQEPVTYKNYFLLGLDVPFPLLQAPFLYLYTASSTNQLPGNRKWLLLHLIPFIITVLYFFPLFVMPAYQKIDLYVKGTSEYETANSILVMAIQLSGLVYIGWSFWLLRKHKQNIGEQFSYEEKINLNWLRYLIYGLLAIWCVIILLKEEALIYGAGVVFIVLLGFFGIRQQGIFNQAPPATQSTPLIQSELNTPVKELKEEILPKKKYAGSILTEEMRNDIHQRLTQLMQQDKFYTEPELSLTQLADKLSIHPNYLSQVINEKEGKTFFDYINSLRVEEFKRQVSNPQNSRFTMQSIAYDCGFNSKSSFNKNFKKITGISPTKYVSGLGDKG